jgi:integrase
MQHQSIVEGAGLTWHGAHSLRRGIATNLYSLGASDKIVQRILRHAKAAVTRERKS